MSALAVFKGIPAVFSMTIRRRADDYRPIPQWMTYMLRLAGPIVISALSAYAATMIALTKSDAVKSEQIITLKENDQQIRSDFRDLQKDMNERLRTIETQHAQLIASQNEILRYVQRRDR